MLKVSITFLPLKMFVRSLVAMQKFVQLLQRQHSSLKLNKTTKTHTWAVFKALFFSVTLLLLRPLEPMEIIMKREHTTANIALNLFISIISGYLSVVYSQRC